MLSIITALFFKGSIDIFMQLSKSLLYFLGIIETNLAEERKFTFEKS